MTTLKDVAKIADVNISTISRYLAGKLNVTPQTEKRIIDAIQQTGYQPNIIAQSLRSGFNPTIAVVVPDIYQPGIAGTISGIDDQLVGTDYSLTMAMTKGSAARELEVVRNLRQMMVAGVVIVGHPFGERNTVQALKDAIGENIPITFISRNFRMSKVTEVCPDQEKGARDLTQHLIDQGYRSIGIIVGSEDHPDARVKLAGYQNALEANGIEPRKEWIEEGFFQTEQTRAATECLVRQNVEVIFCTSDSMAVSAAQFLQQEKGLTIPDDIALTGYGGTIWAEIFSPKLTTVDVQVEQLGRTAIEYLLNHIKDPSAPPSLIIRPVELKIGETTSKAK